MFTGQKNSLKRAGGWLLQSGLQGLAALGVSAVLWLPLMEFTRLTTRANLSPVEILAFSLPPSRLLGLLLPTFGGYAEWVVYPGAVVVLLVVIVVGQKLVRQRALFWLVLALLGLVISLGSLWPGAETFARLPLFNLLRVPSRAWFLTGMALTILAAYGFDDLLENGDDRANRRTNLILAAVTALAVLIGIGMVILVGAVQAGMIWGAAAYLLGFVLQFLFQRKTEEQSWLAGVLVALVVMDLGGVNLLGVNFRSKSEVYGEGANAALYLANQSGDFRVYSPSYSIPQQTAAKVGLELVDGINPLQLASTAGFIEKASGVQSTGYSVTVPAFATGDPKVDNRNAKPDTQLLGLLNVKYLVSEFVLPTEHLSEVWQAGTTHIYENLDFKPRVWVQPMNSAPGSDIISGGTIIRQSANELAAQVEGPGLVVLSMVDYPGWQLKVDGQIVEKLRIANLLIGTEVGDGTHAVELTFTSPLLTLGQVIAIITWLVVLGYAAFSMRHRHERGSLESA